uniref:Cadherin N-terminal domain-containing protein n=1 Tax=Glossina morsitans morsitans TaxID=37546 RepID=A0ABK9NGA8_GLOMM
MAEGYIVVKLFALASCSASLLSTECRSSIVRRESENYTFADILRELNVNSQVLF